MRRWKNLKKWQKGGLIGLGIGFIFVCILLISPPGGIPRSEWDLGEWVFSFHMILPMIIWIWGVGQGESSLAAAIVEYGGLAAIVIFYGVSGMLVGRFQQMANLYWKWSLTALLALLLLGFYWFNFQLAMVFE